jgi:hypothetical protein
MTIKVNFLQSALRATLVLSTTAYSLAQSPNGTIRGTVLDPSGALVPRAQVTVSNAVGLTRRIKSGPAGSFEIPNLAPGIYSIGISANGFTPSLEGGVQVTRDKVTDERIKLGISVNQVVEVFANAGRSRKIQSLNTL